MKVLIAGGAGFIGTNLSIDLVSEGHEVVILDNFSSSPMEKISSLEILKKTGNIRDKKTIRFINPLLLDDGSLIVHSSHTYNDPGILFKFDKCGKYISHNQNYGYLQFLHLLFY